MIIKWKVINDAKFKYNTDNWDAIVIINNIFIHNNCTIEKQRK